MSDPTRRHFAVGAAALVAGVATGLVGRSATAFARAAGAYNDPDDPFYNTQGPPGAGYGDVDNGGLGAEPDPYYPSGGPRPPGGPGPSGNGAAGVRPDANAPLESRMPSSVDYARAYAAKPGDQFPIPAVPWKAINPNFLRQPVAYSGSESPGTIVIDPRGHHLYLIADNGRAMRYGVGVGREGFAWHGDAVIKSKQEWPDWYPPKEMIARQPEIARQMSELQSGIGMHGGPRNPLGARAMYLWQGNKDTLYRIHGTVEPLSIGKSVSSGCIRMLNQDVMDLYNRTPIGTKVVVLN